MIHCMRHENANENDISRKSNAMRSNYEGFNFNWRKKHLENQLLAIARTIICIVLSWFFNGMNFGRTCVVSIEHIIT